MELETADLDNLPGTGGFWGHSPGRHSTRSSVALILLE